MAAASGIRAFRTLLYREPVRIWDLPPNLRGLAASCLQTVPKGHLGETLRREADVLRLLSDLWDTVSDGIEPHGGANGGSRRYAV